MSVALTSEGRGIFISFEGGDGVGKSTQIARVADLFRARGFEVVQTREPGGAPGAEDIRALLVAGEADRWTPMSEALMMYAARAEHLAATIKPALARGAVVLCDRFADSTMAYQGYAGDLGVERIKALHTLVVGEDDPDATIILHLKPGDGLSRATARLDAATDGVDEGRFERKGGAFQARVEDAFLKIAADNPERCILIDASQSIDAVTVAIMDSLDQRFVAGKADQDGE